VDLHPGLPDSILTSHPTHYVGTSGERGNLGTSPAFQKQDPVAHADKEEGQTSKFKFLTTLSPELSPTASSLCFRVKTCVGERRVLGTSCPGLPVLIHHRGS
jgi:hypothetical protein